MKQNNILGHLMLGLGVAAAVVSIFVSSCSKWTEPQAENYYVAPSQAYKSNLKDYFKSPHKVMFGWFGNWGGKGGGSKQYALCGLPDSVDFVSLWLMLGNITPAQQADLDDFHARGSKAVYCFTSNDIGKWSTPKDVVDVPKFWGFDSGKEEDFIKASEKYAMAIVDSCKKYRVDGFDIDLELTGTLINFDKPERLNAFMRVLRKEFDKFNGLLVADIPAGWNSYYTMLDKDVLLSLDYIIWQTYSEAGSHTTLDNMFLGLKSYHGGDLDLWEKVVKKSIVTATFERAIDKPKFNNLPIYHPSFGIEHAGIGAYHIEYDYPGNPDYAMVRKASSIQNPPINE
ncbi:MAG: glycoside hydrolase family 18 [Candidatus Cryptobacteroides sp.]